jgi:WD40 repeat protein
VAFSPDCKRIVTASADRTARIWDADSGKEMAVLQGAPKAAFSADGKRVVTTSEDNTARIWDAHSGKEMAVLKGHTADVLTAAFGVDGKQVLTASSDHTARIWDAEGGNEIVVPIGSVSSNTLVRTAFSGDGKRVVTSSDTARIWDAESGGMIAVLKGHAGIVRAAAFSGDGKRVLTAWTDNTIRIWDVSWATLERGDALRERVCHEKLTGAAQEFTNSELQDDPILRGIDKNDPVARNPCLRRGPLSLDYWTRLPGELWHSMHRLVGIN